MACCEEGWKGFGEIEKEMKYDNMGWKQPKFRKNMYKIAKDY